jgi:hypothetical protein
VTGSPRPAPLPNPAALKQRDRLPTESQIEARVVQYARARGLRADKFTSPNRRSVPDRIVLCPGGQLFFIEFKRPKRGKGTDAQAREHEDLRRLGFAVYIIDDVEEGKQLIDRYADA